MILHCFVPSDANVRPKTHGLDEPASFKRQMLANPTLMFKILKGKVVLARAMQVYSRETPTATKQRSCQAHVVRPWAALKVQMVWG
jgi:hypothetical protein